MLGRSLEVAARYASAQTTLFAATDKELRKSKDERSKDPKNLNENLDLLHIVVHDFMDTRYIARISPAFANKEKLATAIKHRQVTVIGCRNLSILFLLIFGGGMRGDAIRNMLIVVYIARRIVNGMVLTKVYQ